MSTADDLTDFEAEVLRLLLAGEDPVLAHLRQQLAMRRGVERELSGAGFFVKFDIPKHAPRVPGRRDFHFGDVGASMPGLQHGAGFVLFVRNGALDMLEGYSFEEPWPESISTASVRYVGNGSRDLETVRKAWS